MLVFLATSTAKATARALDALGERTVRLGRQARGAGPLVEVVGNDEYGRDSGSPVMHSGPTLTRAERKRKRSQGVRGKFVAIGLGVLATFTLLVWVLALAL